MGHQRDRNRRRATLVVGLLVMAMSIPVATAAAETTGTMVVTSDTTLTQDHQGTIVIDADGVTLDCAGHTVGGGAGVFGISVTSHSGVTIRNCEVVGFTAGIGALSSTDVTVTSNTTTDNYHGMWLDHVSNLTVEANSSFANGDNGIAIVDSDAVRVIGNTASWNLGTGGIAIERTSGDFRNNIVRGNSNHGIAVGWSQDVRFFGNSVTLNTGWAGFFVQGSSRLDIEGNVVDENGGFGLYLGSSSSSVIANNRLTGNPADGVHLESAHSSVITENVAVGNGSGFVLVDADTNFLAANRATGNTNEGFKLVDADENTFEGNFARENVTGVGLYGSSENLFLRNRFIDSGGGTDGEGGACCWGVWVTDSSNDNRFVRNLSAGSDYENFTVAFGSSGNRLISNVSRGSAFEGISLYFGATDNVVRGNVVIRNATSGVLIYESSNNTVIDNTVEVNNLSLTGDAGGIAVLAGSSSNRIVGNRACQNGNADGYDDGSGTDNVWELNKFCTGEI